jgi:2',3'-cyclic-nucleotide 2'-phosphodiesterase (5'-nucleotidase family)
MAQTEIIMRRILSILALACILAPTLSSQEIKWKKVPVQGELTGVTAPTATNVPEAIGTVKGKTYTAPNGRRFRGGATASAARLMLEAQPPMAKVKEVIGYCPQPMNEKKPESSLSNFLVDALMSRTALLTDRKVDIGLMNFGGIRSDMPVGDVTVDDIMSMVPFRNHLVYVALKGSDVKRLFEDMARGPMQVVGGVQVTVGKHQLIDLKVGGESVDDDRIYGLATIDFLLDGGDRIFAARNAVELIQTDELIYDMVLERIRTLTAEGKPIEYHTDGRVKKI